MTAPSTPIDECLKECTADERKALAARLPPYDGVRTWGDLLVVRERAMTLLGMKIVIDPTVPPDTIELRDDRDRVVGKIYNIG